jgi:hypothetical protein
VSTSEAAGSEAANPANDFERWIAGAFATTGPFTALVVLVETVENQVAPMCSIWLNFAAGDVEWSDLALTFAGAGREWDGAAFFPVSAPDGGPVDNPAARVRLRELEARIDDDLLALNDGAFFDRSGRRMQIEKETLQCSPMCS